MSEQDYCKKMWEDKKMDEEAKLSVDNTMEEGMVSGIKWGLILGVPWLFFCIYILNN